MPKYNLYVCDGPVMHYETCIEQNWHGETYATSEKKARSNLAYQYKMNCHRTPNYDIRIPGEIIMVEEMVGV